MAYSGVWSHGWAVSRGLTCLAGILSSALLICSQVVGAGVVRDTILEDPGVGRCWVSSPTPVGVVCLCVCCVCVCVCVCVHAYGSLVFHTHSQNDAYCDTVDEDLGWEINVWEDPLPQELDVIAESWGGPHGPAGATHWKRREEANINPQTLNKSLFASMYIFPETHKGLENHYVEDTFRTLCPHSSQSVLVQL